MVGVSVADELVVHGWDVARATGQPYSAEPELLDAAQTFLGFFASPDAPAGPEVPFGPSRPVADGSAPLDRVVALRAGTRPGPPADPADVMAPGQGTAVRRGGAGGCARIG